MGNFKVLSIATDRIQSIPLLKRILCVLWVRCRKSNMRLNGAVKPTYVFVSEEQGKCNTTPRRADRGETQPIFPLFLAYHVH